MLRAAFLWVCVYVWLCAARKLDANVTKKKKMRRWMSSVSAERGSSAVIT